MENEEFRSLVTKRNKKKNTKEIAKNAVDTDYHEKKRKRSNKKDCSSDEDYHTSWGCKLEKHRNNVNEKYMRRKIGEKCQISEPKWKQIRRLKKQKKLEAQGIITYRDRARERREGKNIDYENTSKFCKLYDDINTHENPVNRDSREFYLDKEMTKFLGGDEAHTHLVKGLDKTLAEKVRREEKLVTKSNINCVTEIVIQDGIFSIFSERIDIASLLNKITPRVHSHLGKKMLRYLKSNLSFYNNRTSCNEEKNKKYINIAPNLNRMCCNEMDFNQKEVIMLSSFVFSLVANVYDRHKAWEKPKENIISHIQHLELHGRGSDHEPMHIKFGSHLDEKIIKSIKSALTKYRGKIRVEDIETNNYKKLNVQSTDNVSKTHIWQKKIICCM